MPHASSAAWNMREPDEAAWVVSLCLVHAVVDQAAGSKVWLIKAAAAGEHRNVDARLVHHPHMRRSRAADRTGNLDFRFRRGGRPPLPSPVSINSGGV